jgi:hypothetical protein
MNNQTEALEQASIRQYCKVVRMPAIAANFVPLAEQAIKEQHTQCSISGGVAGHGVRGT